MRRRGRTQRSRATARVACVAVLSLAVAPLFSGVAAATQAPNVDVIQTPFLVPMSGGDLSTYGLYLPTGLSSVTLEEGAPGITPMTVVGTAPVISDTSTQITFDVPSPTTFSPPAPTTSNVLG